MFEYCRLPERARRLSNCSQPRRLRTSATMPPAVPWGQLALACLTSSDESAASAHPCSEVWAVRMGAGVVGGQHQRTGNIRYAGAGGRGQGVGKHTQFT